MSLVDPIADALVNIKNNETASKKICIFKPASKLIGEILKVMKQNGYVIDYEMVEDGRQGMYKVILNGKINVCRAIKPRYAVKKNGFDKYEKQFLPSKEVGILIVSTPNGVFSHNEAKKQGIGGRLLAFVY